MLAFDPYTQVMKCSLNYNIIFLLCSSETKGLTPKDLITQYS